MNFGLLQRLLRGYLFSFLAWGSVALIFALDATGPDRASLPNLSHFITSLWLWLPWAIVTPPVLWLVDRFPLDGLNWKRSLPLHLACGVLILAGCHAWKEEVFARNWRGRAQPIGGPPGSRSDFASGPPPPSSSAPGPSGGPRTFTHRHRPRSPGFLPIALFDLPMYLMLVTGAHASLFSRRERERAASLNQARLEALRAQLQPHFLFNTLNTIAGLVHTEPDKADAILIALSNLLRASFATSRELEWPLAREREFIEQYLGIMHTRFEERLQYRLKIDPEVAAALVSPLLLQPLVENAIEHGLQAMPKGGEVSLRGWRTGEELHLSIADNGAGAPGEAPLQEGVGLGNTRARLRELYGRRASLTIQRNPGFTVEIVLPFHASAAISPA